MRTFLIEYKTLVKDFVEYVRAVSSTDAVRILQAKNNRPIKIVSIKMTVIK